MVRGGAAAEPSQVCCCVSGLGVPSHERVARIGSSGRKPLPTFLLVEMTAAPLGVVFLLGVPSWSCNPVTWGSQGENPVQFLDERRRRPWRRVLLGGVVF